MGRNLLFRQHDTTTGPTTCRNLGLLDSSEIMLKDDHRKQGACLSEKNIDDKSKLLRSLSHACRACDVGKCDSKDCGEFKKALAKLNPHCGNWRDLEEWAVQLAACICSQKNRAYKKDPCKLPAEFTSMISLGEYSSEYLPKNFDWAKGVKLSNALGVLAWLNGITIGRYKVLQVPNALQQDRDPRQIMEAVERAKEYKLCPRRVWAIAGSLPDRELNLPALIPFGMRSDKVRHAEHYPCTFDFCEYSRKDFTAQKQRHECSGQNCGLVSFPLQKLEDAALAGNPTAWKLSERSIIEPDQMFMAISHVWADGTGTGPWQAGQVNKCLYDFFCRIASQFQCEGIWWDTICIPRDDKKARNEAMNNLQSNYIDARITLVHDLYLREWEWVDAESACFAIVMSTWFSRGWTSLELAKSGKVKVLFKSETSSSLTIKDLDEDILAKPGEPSSPWRQVATAAIFNLRCHRIEAVNDILTALGPRDTSWPKDMAIISGLLVGVEIPIDHSQHKINQRILKKINRVSHGHLFHNSATMTEGFSWCPNSLLDMPLAPTLSTLDILENGDIVGWWRVFSLDAFHSEQYNWKDTHPLIRVKIQVALENKDKHLFLVEEEPTSITRALVVKIVRGKEKVPRWIHCQFVGPIYFIWPQTGGTEEGEKIRLRIGNVKGMGELEDVKAFEYVMANVPNANVQDAKRSKGGENKGSGENNRSDLNAEEIVDMLKKKVYDFDSKYGKTVLHMAAERGYASAVHLLLDKTKKPDVNVRDSMGRTPLLLAARNGNLDVVKLLLEEKADPQVVDNQQATPLHRAAWGGFKEIVEQLLKNEANPGAPDNRGWLALHLAAEQGEEDVVQVLLKVTNVNDGMLHDGQTVLHCAAWGGSTAVVRLLLEKGADPNSEDFLGRTALHVAAGQGNVRVVHLLLRVGPLVERGTQIERKSREGWTMMHYAAHNGHEEVVRMLINMEAKRDTKNLFECTPLRLAAENGHKAIVELLVEKQADINMQDCYGHTALHRASGMGQEAIAQLLVDKEANVNMQDKIGSTALHLAVDAKHERIVQLLVDSGADVNVTAKRTEMPLHLAAHNGHVGIARILVDNKAHVDSKIMYGGMAALHLAAERGHEAVVSLLLEKKVHLESKSGDGQTALGLAAAVGNVAMVQLLLEKNANVHFEDLEGNTPLSLAAAWDGNTAQSFVEPKSSKSFRGSEVVGWQLVEKGAKAKWGLVRLLLEKHVKLESINKDGWTILGLAMAWGDKGMVEPLLEKCPNLCFKDWEQLSLMPCNKRISFGGHKMVGLRLVEKGAQVKAKNKGGWTAMHHAAHKGHEGFMKMLINKGANVDTQNLHKRTPLHLAVEKGREAIVQLLIEKNANVEVEDHTGWCTPLHLAAKEGHQAIVKLLIEKQTNLTDEKRGWQFTPLQLAARNRPKLAAGWGNEAMVELLQKGTNYFYTVDAYNTALSLAASEKRSSFADHKAIGRLLLKHIRINNEGCSEEIVSNHTKSCMEHENKKGWKAMHHAAHNQHEGFMRMRIENEHNINVKGRRYGPLRLRCEPLHLAAKNGHEGIVQLLVEKGAWIDAQDEKNWTALCHAADRGHEGIVQFLLKNGANLNVETCRSLFPHVTALHPAARNGHIGIVELLMKMSQDRGFDTSKILDVQAMDGTGTPLSWAVQYEHEAIVQVFLKKRANPNKQDQYGCHTPLLWAVQKGNKAIVKLLLRWGANPNIKDKDGRTPLLCALEKGDRAIMELLQTNNG